MNTKPKTPYGRTTYGTTRLRPRGMSMRGALTILAGC